MKKAKGDIDFNPRSRVGNDCPVPPISINAGLFQSTFPRGERPIFRKIVPVSVCISIHVPAWGTTPAKMYICRAKTISIHVPAWGTTICSPMIFATVYFNPRSRVGNDNWSVHGEYTTVISIHVPAWGTTLHERAIWEHINISIHVPAWGTTSHTEHRKKSHIFQSTFPHGERPFGLVAVSFFSVISIHVPAWGTTENTMTIDYGQQFQSTFPRGERRHFCIGLFFYNISIHVPAWGTTTTGRVMGKIGIISIHVPAWGTTAYHKGL